MKIKIKGIFEDAPIADSPAPMHKNKTFNDMKQRESRIPFEDYFKQLNLTKSLSLSEDISNTDEHVPTSM